MLSAGPTTCQDPQLNAIFPLLCYRGLRKATIFEIDAHSFNCTLFSCRNNDVEKRKLKLSKFCTSFLLTWCGV